MIDDTAQVRHLAQKLHDGMELARTAQQVHREIYALHVPNDLQSIRLEHFVRILHFLNHNAHPCEFLMAKESLQDP